jgi:folylpolyglutamate synthase/dihydropteroate synthase
MPRDKEVRKLIAHFADAGAQRVMFTRYPGERATAPDELAPLWQRRCAAPAEVFEEPEQAFARAVDVAGENGAVIVTGSIHLAGVLRPFARARQTMPDRTGTTMKKFV